MTLYRVSLTEINYEEAASVEQDQTACMCSLILLYSLHNINPWSRIAGGWNYPKLQRSIERRIVISIMEK